MVLVVEDDGVFLAYHVVLFDCEEFAQVYYARLIALYAGKYRVLWMRFDC